MFATVEHAPTKALCGGLASLLVVSALVAPRPFANAGVIDTDLIQTATLAKPVVERGLTSSEVTPVVDGKYLGSGAVQVEGAGFEPSVSVSIEVDVAWPHASIACSAARSWMVRTDQTGGFTAVLTAHGVGRDDCRLDCDRYRAYVDRADHQRELAISAPFACPGAPSAR